MEKKVIRTWLLMWQMMQQMRYRLSRVDMLIQIVVSTEIYFDFLYKYFFILGVAVSSYKR